MQTTEQVDTTLASLETKHVKAASLKSQIRFRKNILGQEPSDPKLYNLSIQTEDKKRRQLSIAELTENVKTLIQEALEQPEHAEQAATSVPTHLLDCRVEHRFEEEGGTKWYKATVNSQV